MLYHSQDITKIVGQKVIKDTLFKVRLEEAMQSWLRVQGFQGSESDKMNTIMWWEMLVKPGIKKLGIERGKEINKERREHLNLLLFR